MDGLCRLYGFLYIIFLAVKRNDFYRGFERNYSYILQQVAM